MPDYTIKDPATGRVTVVRGDSPPTADELEDIFAKIPKNAPPMSGPQASSYLGDVAKYAGGEVVGFARGLTDLVNPMTYIHTAKGVAEGVQALPAYVRGFSREDLTRAPGQALEAAESFAQDPEAVGRLMGNVVAGKAGITPGGAVTAARAVPGVVSDLRAATTEPLAAVIAKKVGVDPAATDLAATKLRLQAARSRTRQAQFAAKQAEATPAARAGEYVPMTVDELKAFSARIKTPGFQQSSEPFYRQKFEQLQNWIDSTAAPQTPSAAPSAVPQSQASAADMAAGRYSLARPPAAPQGPTATAPSPSPAAPTPVAPTAAPEAPAAGLGDAANKVHEALKAKDMTLTAEEHQAAIGLVGEGYPVNAVLREIAARKLSTSLGLPTEAEMRADMGNRARGGQKSLMPEYGDEGADNPYR